YALMTTIYLSLMGPKGLRETAEQNLQKSHYLARQIDSLPGFRLKYRAPFFNEFVVSCPRPANEVLDRLLSRRIIGGLALSRFFPNLQNEILICVTEATTHPAIDRMGSALAEIRAQD